MPVLVEIYSPERIEKLCGVRTFARAVTIDEASIEDRKETDGRLSATVRGTMPYRTAIWVEGSRGARYSCTCPQGTDGKFCKHCGALALSIHAGGRRDFRFGTRREVPVERDSDPVFAYLNGLESPTLVGWVYDAALRDETTRRRIEESMAVALGREPIDVRQWKKTITSTFGRPSHYVDYYEAPRWAQRVNALLSDLGQLLDDGYADQVVGLIEYAFERTDRAVQYVDSSDGWFQEIEYKISEIHLRACQESRPHVISLARRLAKFELDSELDTFHRASATYSAVLGIEGLTEYRSIIEPLYRSLPPRSKDPWSSVRGRLTDAMIGLAMATGDVDEVIAIRGSDLRSPYDYREIVSALTAAGRSDEAIEWAQQGLKFDGTGRTHQKRELRQSLVDLLCGIGKTKEAYDVVLMEFTSEPSLTNFHQLMNLTAVDKRPARRSQLLKILRTSIHDTPGETRASVLVQIYLYDGEIDDAWAAAQKFGCSDYWWMTIAKAREGDHPSDSIPIYQRSIDALVDKKQRTSYAAAVDQLKRVKRLFLAAGNSDGWSTYIGNLRSQHRLKSSFMSLLDSEELM